MGNSTEDDNDFYADIIDAPEFWSGLAIAGMILSVMITLSNAVLLFTIYKDPRRSFRTPPSFLIANLSAAEFLQGSVAVFLVALRDVYRYQRAIMPQVKVFKAVIYTVVCSTLFVSSTTIIAMSMTCYFAINKPILYKNTVTTRRIKVSIGLIWTTALLMSFLPATNIPEKTYTLIYLHTHATIPAILLTMTYVKVFQALARRTSEARQSFKESELRTRHNLLRERNMVITIIIVLTMFYITYIPQYITLHLLYLCKACGESLTFHKIDVVLSRFLFISSAVDPFIYAWRVPKYRRALKDCFKMLPKDVRFRFLSTRTNTNEISISSGLWIPFQIHIYYLSDNYTLETKVLFWSHASKSSLEGTCIAKSFKFRLPLTCSDMSVLRWID